MCPQDRAAPGEASGDVFPSAFSNQLLSCHPPPRSGAPDLAAPLPPPLPAPPAAGSLSAHLRGFVSLVTASAGASTWKNESAFSVQVADVLAPDSAASQQVHLSKEPCSETWAWRRRPSLEKLVEP